MTISLTFWGALHCFPRRFRFVLCAIRPIIQSNCIITYVRGKIVPENSSPMLVPDRVYKENRANWNANYQQADSMKHGNANWSLPAAWQEPPSRMWNQSNQSNQMKSARKVSAKQHYLSVARYVAGQSTNLPSRYRKFRALVGRLLLACTMLILCHVLVRSHIGPNAFPDHSVKPAFELAPLGKNDSHNQMRRSCNVIVHESIPTLIDITRHLAAALARVLFPFDMLLPSIPELVEFVHRAFWITADATYLSYSYRILLIHFDQYLCRIKYFSVLKDSLIIWMDQITRSFTVRVTRMCCNFGNLLFY